MKPYQQDLIAEAARALACKAHSEDDLHAALYQLVLDVRSPQASGEPPRPTRRVPLANEVLPRHQRASWARGKTIFDRDEG